MIASLLGLIFALVIIGVLFWAAKRLLALIPLDEPFKTLVYVLAVIIGVIIVIWVLMWLLSLAGVHVALPALR